MSKIQHAFENGKKAFIPFITCGDPDLFTTAAVVREMVAAGADLIALGIPFSDPTAEGTVVQEANIRALDGGITTDDIFAFVRDLRQDVQVPMLFVTYANVIFSYGAERFMSICQTVGIDGLVLSDLPYEEKEEFLAFCHTYDVDLISTIAATARDRIAMIAREAEGVLYITSRTDPMTELNDRIENVRAHTNLPCIIGMDFANLEQIRALITKVDGIVVDSAIVELIASYGKDAVSIIGDFVREMKEKLFA